MRAIDADGNELIIDAKLVVGADGRRSTIAAEVGSFRPYRASPNGRGLVLRYADDPHDDTRAGQTIFQWWERDSLSFMFPSVPRGRALLLFMGAAGEVDEAKADPEGYWTSKLGKHPRMAARVAGVTNMSPLMSTNQTSSFFRASSGPGWALAGDAGHFKDPVIGQGQRDAMWSGRVLGEYVADVLDDPAALDLALRQWEVRRDKECLPSYHFGNLETRVEETPPVLAEVIRLSSAKPDPDLSDLFGRARSMPQILTVPRLSRGLVAAIRNNNSELPARDLVSHALHDLRVHLALRRERQLKRFRSHIPLEGSEHAHAEPPTYRATGRTPSSRDTPAGPTPSPANAPETAQPATSAPPTRQPANGQRSNGSREARKNKKEVTA